MKTRLTPERGSIAVWAGYGGKGLIEVRDDGCGMDADDARTCLLRHATSKIADAEDIERIATLGFRGEALPSIASVSRLTLITRRPCDDAATIIKTAGGVVESESQCVAEPGTTHGGCGSFFQYACPPEIFEIRPGRIQCHCRGFHDHLPFPQRRFLYPAPQQ